MLIFMNVLIYQVPDLPISWSRSWGDRSSSLMVAAPRLWNNLPPDIQHNYSQYFQIKIKNPLYANIV